MNGSNKLFIIGFASFCIFVCLFIFIYIVSISQQSTKDNKVGNCLGGKAYATK